MFRGAVFAAKLKVSTTPVAVPPVSVRVKLPLSVNVKVSAAVPPVRLSKPLNETLPVATLISVPELTPSIVQFVLLFAPMKMSVTVGLLLPMKLSIPAIPPVDVAVFD
jgi:hypothetical protein